MNALPTPPHAAFRHRPMTVTDLPSVMAIEGLAYAFPWSHGNFVDSLAAGYWTALRLSDQGELLAYAVAMPAVDELHLLNLTVSPAHTGRGHARALLDELEVFAGSRSLRSIWLEVRTDNERARTLYRRRGFAEVGRRPAYYPAPRGRREDAIVMRLPLEPSDGLD